MSRRPDDRPLLSAVGVSPKLLGPKTVVPALLPLSTARFLIVTALMSVRALNALSAAAIGSLWALAALAQLTTGAVIGSILDTHGKALAGVTVTVESDELPGGARTFVTDRSGQYRFPNLPPGLYELTASLPAFGRELLT